MSGQRHAAAALYPGKDPVPIVQETGWAPGPVWTGAENLAPTGIRSPNRPARGQSLYRLSYPALAPPRTPLAILVFDAFTDIRWFTIYNFQSNRTMCVIALERTV